MLKHQIIGDKQRIKRFRTQLSVFFISLIIPLAFLSYYGFQQIESDVNIQYHWKSVNVLKQINKQLNQRLKVERKRPVGHYSFYQVVSNPLSNTFTKEISPLASPENYVENIGLMGYFQINPDKTLQSPLLPYQTSEQIEQADTNLKWSEIKHRLAIKDKLTTILQANDFVIETTKNIYNANNKLVLNSEAQVELFQLKITQSNELIFFRNVWQDQQHHIQGFIVDKRAYLDDVLTEHFAQGHYENAVQMLVWHSLFDAITKQYFTYQTDIKGQASVKSLSVVNEALNAQHIYNGKLIAPFQRVQIKFTSHSFQLGFASQLVVFFLVLLIVVIIAGCLGLYWVGVKQIALAEQRMNFVSAVSHELKTPLTTILMYSEMLKSGMVKDAKNQLDYHEFIFSESSRLSRLINNILRLSNINRQQGSLEFDYVSIAKLTDTIRSKVSSLTDKKHFEVNITVVDDLSSQSEVLVDLDAFTQIVINLVDNAIKFFESAKIENQERRKIDIGFSIDSKSKNKLVFSVRDYGPGIAKSEHDKIFGLFYREGNEMTRTTPGTGIGLALVNELVMAQGGRIDVKNHSQGVSFAITFSYRDTPSKG
ncbi:sensor histidine kinase [Paraglaciecola sp.]|uniref:sensor histidine kinase n=1 Tax=Paraglaciecola sp. TaxID=1920173 RepID=UPI003EF6839B